MNIPNTITLLRLLLSLILFAFILHLPQNYICIIILISVIMLGDMLDGYFARKYNQATKFGAWFDIASDRFIEIAILFVFASINIITIWIPIIFLLRGILVDGIRSIVQSESNQTAFNMMKSSIGHFLVSSQFMRFSYAVIKLMTFILLAIALKYSSIILIANIFAIISTILCIIRGLPVLVEGSQFLKDNK